MQFGGAIKRYAQAVFALAHDSHSFDAWQRDLAAMADLVNDEEGRRLFNSPKVDADQKIQVAERYLRSRISPLAMNLTRLLIERDRFGQAARLSEAFAELVRDHQGLAVAEVTTATALDAAASATVSRQLGDIVGKRIELRERVDPAIIGGIIAHVGDYLIDGSVTGQLSRMRVQLVEGR